MQKCLFAFASIGLLKHHHLYPALFPFLRTQEDIKALMSARQHPATRQELVILPSARLDVLEKRGSELGSGAREFLHLSSRRKTSLDLTFLPQCFQEPPSHTEEQLIAGYWPGSSRSNRLDQGFRNSATCTSWTIYPIPVHSLLSHDWLVLPSRFMLKLCNRLSFPIPWVLFLLLVKHDKQIKIDKAFKACNISFFLGLKMWRELTCLSKPSKSKPSLQMCLPLS